MRKQTPGNERAPLREIASSTSDVYNTYHANSSHKSAETSLRYQPTVNGSNYERESGRKTSSTSDFSARVQSSIFAPSDLAVDRKGSSYSNSASGLVVKKMNKQGNLFDWNFAASSSNKSKYPPAQKISILEFTTKKDIRGTNHSNGNDSNVLYGFKLSNNQGYDSCQKNRTITSPVKEQQSSRISTDFVYNVDDYDDDDDDVVVVDISGEREKPMKQAFHDITTTQSHTNNNNRLPSTIQKIIATFGLQNAKSSMKRSVRFLPSSSDSSSEDENEAECDGGVDFNTKKSSAAVVSSSEKTAKSSFDHDNYIEDFLQNDASFDFGNGHNEDHINHRNRKEDTHSNKQSFSRRSRRVIVDDDEEERNDSDAEEDEVASLESMKDGQRRTSADDDVKCAVCMDPEAAEDDPIIFCDGSCNTCVHKSCYGLEVGTIYFLYPNTPCGYRTRYSYILYMRKINFIIVQYCPLIKTVLLTD